MILFRDCLNEAEAKELEHLAETCSHADGLSWSVPDDADLYFLFYEDAADFDCLSENSSAKCSLKEAAPSLSAVLCVFHMGDTKNGLPIDELIALTRPDARRRGYFRALFSTARPLLRPMIRFSLPTASSEKAAASGKKNAASRQFLLQIGAEHDHDEYLMELQLSKTPAANTSAAETFTAGTFAAHALYAVSEAPPIRLHFNMQDGITAVSCRYGECFLSDWSDGVYLFGLLVYERFRGQGFGSRILHALFSRLCMQSGSRVVLEVSSDNLPAVKLYQKMGFQTIDAVSYFYLENPDFKKEPLC